MSKGQLPKVYLRLDPDADQHPDVDGLVRLMCAAARQRPRGRFQRETVLRLLGRKRFAQWTAPRPGKARPDLVELEGLLYLDGWDEWQEGDLTVGDRVRRLRERRSNAVTTPLPGRNPDRKPDRKPPSEALGVRALGTERSKNITAGVGGAAAIPAGARNGPPPAAAGAAWVDYDPGNALEARLVKRCEELADLVSALTGEAPPGPDEYRLVLYAITGTERGKSMDVIRGASAAWIERSLSASEDFERDVRLERTPPDDDDNPEPPAKPAEEA